MSHMPSFHMVTKYKLSSLYIQGKFEILLKVALN
jgi:hypothetical protein